MNEEMEEKRRIEDLLRPQTIDMGETPDGEGNLTKNNSESKIPATGEGAEPPSATHNEVVKEEEEGEEQEPKEGSHKSIPYDARTK